MKAYDCNTCVISSLDQIAWLLNLRGGDIPFNPVFKSYLVINEDNTLRITLYSDLGKFKSQEVREYLKNIKVDIKPYNEIANDLKDICNKKIGLELSTVNMKVLNLINSENSIIDLKEEITYLKVKKNEVELNGYRSCYIRDAIGLIKYIAWLKHQLNGLHRTDITEYTGAEKLTEFRKEQEKFMGLSFNTISAIGPNASIVHYKPEKHNSLILNNKEIYLLDSGAQYLYCQQ